MTETASPSLLARKIAASRLRADPSVISAARAVGPAFARSAETLMKMPVRMLAQTDARQSGGEIVDTLPDQALIALTQGPQDAVGLAVVSADALACLIEMLTFGRLAERGPAPRRPTRTDAAMVAEFLDAVLGNLESALAGQADLVWAGGFRYGSHLPDPRPLALMLDEPAYRTMRCRVGFGPPPGNGGEGRAGDIHLIFPVAGRGVLPEAAPDRTRADGRAALGEAEWQGRLARAVSGAPVAVEAVLARITLPLAAVLKLEAGVSLPVPIGVLQAVRLEGDDASLVCLARLGQGGGHRMLRLDLPEDGLVDEPVPPSVHAGEVLAAEPPAAPGRHRSAADPAKEADAVARARAAEAEADGVMEAALTRVARAG